MSFRLPKSTKLCSQTAIDRLFAQRDVEGALAYPLRAVWGRNPLRTRGDAVQFVASVPKKRIRHAVDRVLMRRRIREAYRLNRAQHAAPQADGEAATPLDILFIYVGNLPEPYAKVEGAMRKLLRKINVSSGKPTSPAPDKPTSPAPGKPTSSSK